MGRTIICSILVLALGLAAPIGATRGHGSRLRPRRRGQSRVLRGRHASGEQSLGRGRTGTLDCGMEPQQAWCLHCQYQGDGWPGQRRRRGQSRGDRGRGGEPILTSTFGRSCIVAYASRRDGSAAHRDIASPDHDACVTHHYTNTTHPDAGTANLHSPTTFAHAASSVHRLFPGQSGTGGGGAMQYRKLARGGQPQRDLLRWGGCNLTRFPEQVSQREHDLYLVGQRSRW
jgi:hypothetical protein